MNRFSETLIEWYGANGRDLPWRKTSDPYRIWISEIVLQQTRVAQGMDYFRRFMERFPDVTSLAEAPEDEVMRCWQGLGYYSRARNLHEAARSMNGRFPDTYQGVRALKGVGDYTAAAICSFAYQMPYAVVDGNVYRVLARYWGIDTPIDSTEGKKLFARLAQELLDPRRPALHNQAIMDFGALQCTPQSPACRECPLADSCQALASGQVDRLPVKRHKTQVTERFFYYIYVRAGACTYLHKRQGADIWQNLYELPLLESDRPLAEEEFLQWPRLHALFPGGCLPELHRCCARVKHVLSHQILYADFYEVQLPEEAEPFAGCLKVRREELEQYAIPRLIEAFLEKYA